MRRTEAIRTSGVVAPPAFEPAASIPLHYQLSSSMERHILSGEWPAGARLEPELQLGARLGLSRTTVRRAILTLVDRGLLVRTRGVGTTVVGGAGWYRPDVRVFELGMMTP